MMDNKRSELTERLLALQKELQLLTELSVQTDESTARKRRANTSTEELHRQLTAADKTLRLLLKKKSVWEQQRRAAVSFFGLSRRYNIILVDPPWQYRTPTWTGGTHNHYSTLTLKQLRELPVLGLAADDCMLLLWATWPKMEEAIELMRDWGFAYKTIFTVWIKQNKLSDRLAIGAGCYTRSNSEPLLLGTRGYIARYQQAVNFVSVYVSRKSRHSEKPAAIYDMIFDRIGDVPRCELFARNRRRGWDAWGNQCAHVPEDEREQQLKARQDRLSNFAHVAVRQPPKSVVIPNEFKRRCNNSRNTAKIYAQTLYVTNDYNSIK